MLSKFTSKFNLPLLQKLKSIFSKSKASGLPDNKNNEDFSASNTFTLLAPQTKLDRLKIFFKKNNSKVLVFLVILVCGLGVLLFRLKSPDRGLPEDRLFTNEEEGFTKLVIPEREQAFFELKTQDERKYGILPRESFVLKTLKPVTLDYINSILSESEKFNIRQINESEYKIENSDQLGPDEPIAIKLNTDGKEIGGYVFDRDYSWSFQSQGKFRIVSTIPGNEKTKVPLESGIEFIFSQDGFTDPTRLIEINPRIDFSTKTVDETFVVIPKEKLTPETVYTVKLKKGLRLTSRDDQINEDYQFSFQTQELAEPAKPKPWIDIQDTFIQTAPTEPFITKVLTNNWASDLKVEIRVYEFTDSSSFMNSRSEYDRSRSGWREYYPNQYRFSEGLPEVMKEDVVVQTQKDLKYIQLSKTLDPGYYLLEFAFEGKLVSHQVWYQSTELSGYLALGKEQIIIWSNNLASKSPSAGAQVRSMTSGGTWTTNDDGVAKLPSSQAYFDGSPHYFEITDKSGNSLVLPLSSQKGRLGPGEKSSIDFWSYLYTEKIYYSENDTVNVWGIVKDRTAGVPPNARLVLVAPKGEEVYTQNLTPSSDGSFIAEVALVDAPVGWYQLHLKVGDTNVEEVGFSVQEYVKPDMKIEIAANKKAIFSEEEVEFSIKTSFFDETPGSNITLNIYEDRGGGKTERKTDDNGNIKYVYKPTYQSGSYYPRYEGISAIPALTQQSIIQGNGSVNVYGPRIMINAEKSQTSDRASFTATLNRIDLNGVNSGTTNDVKGKEIANQELKVSVTENWTERVETGTAYNFIEKVTYKTYRYDRKSKKISDTAVKTDQEGKASYEFDMIEGRSYEVSLSTVDEKGHIAESKLYFYASKWANYYNQKTEDTNIYLDIAG